MSGFADSPQMAKIFLIYLDLGYGLWIVELAGLGSGKEDP
jgi:hypothetical protein